MRKKLMFAHALALVGASIARASDFTVARGVIEQFALHTCERSACYDLSAREAKHGMSGGLTLRNVRLRVVKSGALVRDIIGDEASYDQRTRSVVLRNADGSNCFVDLPSADARCFNR